MSLNFHNVQVQVALAYGLVLLLKFELTALPNNIC